MLLSSINQPLTLLASNSRETRLFRGPNAAGRKPSAVPTSRIHYWQKTTLTMKMLLAVVRRVA